MKRQRLSRFVAVFCAVSLFCLTLTAQETTTDANADTKTRVKKLFELGISYAREQKFDQAIDAYRELLTLDPVHAFALHNLGAALANTKRHQEALEAFQSAVNLAPGNATFQASLGGAYMNLRRWDESLAVLSEAVRLDPTRGATYNMLGFLFDNTRRFDEALAVNKKAIEYAPENPANFHNLGLTYIKLGKPADAIAPLEQALKMAPRYKSARYHLSNVLSRLKRYREAVDSFTKLLELDPDNAELISSRAWNYMYLGGSGREAAADAERYLKLYGWRTNSSPFQALIAIIGFRSVGMGERADAVMVQARKKADPDAWPYNIIQFYDGQMTAEDLLAVAANNDQRTEAHAYVGMFLRLNHKNAEARTHFEWVKEYGTRSFYEYPLALAELERGQ